MGKFSMHLPLSLTFSETSIMVSLPDSVARAAWGIRYQVGGVVVGLFYAVWPIPSALNFGFRSFRAVVGTGYGIPGLKGAECTHFFMWSPHGA